MKEVTVLLERERYNTGRLHKVDSLTSMLRELERRGIDLERPWTVEDFRWNPRFIVVRQEEA